MNGGFIERFKFYYTVRFIAEIQSNYVYWNLILKFILIVINLVMLGLIYRKIENNNSQIVYISFYISFTICIIAILLNIDLWWIVY